MNSLVLEGYNIILTCYFLWDSQKRFQFFENIWLLANISIKVVLRILFLVLNIANIEFTNLKKLI